MPTKQCHFQNQPFVVATLLYSSWCSMINILFEYVSFPLKIEAFRILLCYALDMEY